MPSSLVFAVLLYTGLLTGLFSRSSVVMAGSGVATVAMGFWSPWVAGDLATHKGQQFIGICTTVGLLLIFIGLVTHHLNRGWASSEA